MWRRTYSRTYSVSPHPHIFLPLLVMPFALDCLFRGVIFTSVLVAVPSPCMHNLLYLYLEYIFTPSAPAMARTVYISCQLL